MPTPPTAPYKKSQRECERKLRRGNVLWVSCTLPDNFIPGVSDKVPVQGTYIKALHGPIGTGGGK